MNSLTMTGSGSITNATPAFPTLPYVLTDTSGGLLATGTNAISGGVLTPSNEFDVFTPGSALLNISSAGFQPVFRQGGGRQPG